MTTAAALAHFAVNAKPDDDLTQIIGPAVADCFGCILAGAHSDAARMILDALAPLGTGDSPVFGTNASLPAPYAALVNAVAGHAWELDDWEELGNTHPSVVLVPALLAAAHRHGAGGADLLSAYAVGVEIIMRLGRAITLDHYARGYHATSTLGTIGAAAATARLLGLTAEAAAHALSISVSLAAGYTAQFGTTAKPLQAGFATRAGLEAALLAKAGATGHPGILDGAKGFLMLKGKPEHGGIAQLADLSGDRWALASSGLVLKPWPSCGYTHRLMTAALDLRPALSGRHRDIIEIRACLPDFHHAILCHAPPVSVSDALFSAPACIAQILLSGDLALADGAARFWADPDVARLIAMTTVQAEPARNPTLNYDPAQPDRLWVRLRDGTVLEAACDHPLGAPQNPMSPDDLARKWAAATGRPKEVFARVMGWHKSPDAARFFKEIAQ